MQGFRIVAMSDVEKSKLRRKNFQSQWTVKYRSRAQGQGACLKGMSRTNTISRCDKNTLLQMYSS